MQQETGNVFKINHAVYSYREVREGLLPCFTICVRLSPRPCFWCRLLVPEGVGGLLAVVDAHACFPACFCRLSPEQLQVEMEPAK